MYLVKIDNIKKTFGGNVLFDNLSLEINPSDKVALIGRNGVGKSTLVKIIMNEIAPDSGGIFIFKQATIGYLSQDILSSQEHTMYEECLSVFQKSVDIENRLSNLAKLLETDQSEALLKRYTAAEHEFHILGGYDYLTTIDMLLTKFGFTKEEYNRKIKTFSGGEKTRIAFAKLLMIKPDLLILDEPTNHMDIEIIEWLEGYLKKYDKAVLVITHDKYFINKVVNKIYEIDQYKMDVYHGNYDQYEIEKVKRYEILLKQYLKQRKEIAHLQSFVDRFRYNSKRASLAQDRVKKINRIKKIDRPTNSQRHVNLTFKSKRPTDVHILEVENLSIGYDKPLIENINFKMRGYDKLGIIGGNGTGKTTLIKTIMNHIPALSGQYRFYKDIKIGYFDQNQTHLDERLTIFQTISSIYPNKTLYEVRSDIAKVLFTGEDADKRVSVLSGGEKVRLSILLLMLEEPELLILDEPTNHLDIDTKNVVEDVFDAYVGPIIFISHDRYFINKVATKIISIKDTLIEFDGNYSEYLETIKKIEEEKKTEKKSTKKPKTKENYEKQIIKLEKELDHLDKQLEVLKQDLFLEEVYMNPDLYKSKQVEIDTIQKQIEEYFIEIEKLSELA